MEKCFERTKWNFWKLFKYAIDGIINFSEVPLSIASWFGIIMTFIDFIFIVLIIVRKLCFGDPVSGWASTACIIIFVGAIQLFCMGVMGQYIAKTYTEVKNVHTILFLGYLRSCLHFAQIGKWYLEAIRII